MTVIRSKGLIMAVVGLMLLAIACQPPGAKTESQGGGGEAGKEGEQQVQTGGKAAAGAGTCDVKPPNVTLDEAKVGFSQMENNNPWRIAETASMKDEAEERGINYMATDAQSDTAK